MSKIDQTQERTRQLRKELREGRREKDHLLEEIAHWQEEEKKIDQDQRKLVQVRQRKLLQQEKLWQNKFDALRRKQEQLDKEIQVAEESHTREKEEIESLKKEKDGLQVWLKKTSQTLAISQGKLKNLVLGAKKIESHLRNLEIDFRREKEAKENKLRSYPVFRKQQEVARQLKDLGFVQQRKQQEENRLNNQLRNTLQENLRKRVEQDLARVKGERERKEKEIRDLERKGETLSREANIFSTSLKQEEQREERQYNLETEKEKQNLEKVKKEIAQSETEIGKIEKEMQQKETRFKFLETALKQAEQNLTRKERVISLLKQQEIQNKKQEADGQQFFNRQRAEAEKEIAALENQTKRKKQDWAQRIRQNQLKIRQIDQKLQHAENEMKKALGSFWQELHQELDHDKRNKR